MFFTSILKRQVNYKNATIFLFVPKFEANRRKWAIFKILQGA